MYTLTSTMLASFASATGSFAENRVREASNLFGAFGENLSSLAVVPLMVPALALGVTPQTTLIPELIRTSFRTRTAQPNHSWHEQPGCLVIGAGEGKCITAFCSTCKRRTFTRHPGDIHGVISNWIQSKESKAAKKWQQERDEELKDFDSYQKGFTTPPVVNKNGDFLSNTERLGVEGAKREALLELYKEANANWKQDPSNLCLKQALSEAFIRLVTLGKRGRRGDLPRLWAEGLASELAHHNLQPGYLYCGVYLVCPELGVDLPKLPKPQITQIPPASGKAESSSSGSSTVASVESSGSGSSGPTVFKTSPNAPPKPPRKNFFTHERKPNGSLVTEVTQTVVRQEASKPLPPAKKLHDTVSPGGVQLRQAPASWIGVKTKPAEETRVVKERTPFTSKIPVARSPPKQPPAQTKPQASDCSYSVVTGKTITVRKKAKKETPAVKPSTPPSSHLSAKSQRSRNAMFAAMRVTRKRKGPKP